jgi:hypothetical protein
MLTSSPAASAMHERHGAAGGRAPMMRNDEVLRKFSAADAWLGPPAARM